MRLRISIRTVLALSILLCLLAILLMPSTSVLVVPPQPNGKNLRLVGMFTMFALAAVVYRGLLSFPALIIHHSRQVYSHGYGPDLIDRTCVRLC